MAKLDFNTDTGVKGRFTRLTVYINFEKVLISQVLVNGVVQRVEYESTYSVFFVWAL